MADISYFHLGEEAHVEMETVHHSLALDGPHVSVHEMISCAHMAKHYDSNAYFRSCDDVIYVHWTTERPVDGSMGRGGSNL